MLDTIIIIILILLLFGLLPHWPYSTGWGLGYYPSGLLGVILVIIVILFLLHRV